MLFSNKKVDIFLISPYKYILCIHQKCPFNALLMGTHNLWAEQCENVSLGICLEQRPSSACTSVQSDQDLHCLFIESLGAVDYNEV